MDSAAPGSERRSSRMNTQQAELVSEMNAVAERVAAHPPNCLCSDCERFCELSDVLISSGALSCPRGVCDD